MTSFFLTFFVSMILGSSGLTSDNDCKGTIVLWYEVAAFYSLGTMIILTVLIIRLRRTVLSLERIDFGWFELIFLSYPQGTYTYLLLIFLELLNLGITVWGTLIFLHL